MGYTYYVMTQFTAKQFNIGELVGISAKNIEEHIKLYVGYVKNANLINEHIEELSKDSEKYAYELGEINRRFSFEFNGMKNHEAYFSLLEGGAKEINTESPLSKEIVSTFGSFENMLNRLKAIALTRGIGWAMLSKDHESKSLILHWLDEQHLGQLQNTKPIIALDMWEHSYVADYQPSGKKQYIEDFFKNLNWSVAEDRFK